jgi:excisionase family DNA binding protein
MQKRSSDELDVAACARLLRCTEELVRQRVEERTIPFVRRGGQLRFRRRDLERFLARLTACSPTEAVLNLAARFH